MGLEDFLAHIQTIISSLKTLTSGIHPGLIQGPRSYFEIEGLTSDSKWEGEVEGRGEGGLKARFLSNSL